MRRRLINLTISLLILTFASVGYSQNEPKRDSKPRKFFIESQSDSPILIRDFSATFSPDRFASLQIEVVFYFENKSEKKIKNYTYQTPEADDLNFKDYEVRGWGGNLLSGESQRHNSSYSAEGKAIVFRIKEVEFDDGTKWKAKPFNAAKSKKSEPIIATIKKVDKNPKPKRNLTLEWFKPEFSDQISKTIDGESKIIENTKIKTKIIELKPGIYDEIEFCPSRIQQVEEYDPNIIPFEQDYIIRKVTAYEINGRIFAYVVPFEGIEAETEFEIGVGFENIYVDVNGNGFFKAQCDMSELTSLPQWVKDLSSK